jgi:hypothetical protein
MKVTSLFDMINQTKKLSAFGLPSLVTPTKRLHLQLVLIDGSKSWL